MLDSTTLNDLVLKWFIERSATPFTWVRIPPRSTFHKMVCDLSRVRLWICSLKLLHILMVGLPLKDKLTSSLKNVV